MGAFAVVTMPLDLSRNAASSVAEELIGTFPGTRNVTLDSAGSKVSFEMQFPGNLSDLVSRLRSSRIAVGERAAVSVPVHNLAPEILAGDPGLLATRLQEGPEVFDPQFEREPRLSDARLNGDRVDASIVPSSTSMHELYDALLTLGLVAFDPSQPASGDH